MSVDPATLAPNRFVDSDHPAIRALADAHRLDTPIESAVSLFYAVRDSLRYTPWNVRFTPEAFRASTIVQRKWDDGGHCIDKALVLAAGARALGIPARLHYANVRNHVGTARLEEKLGTDLLVFHGYTELFLEERWVAATPAFNKELCERLGVAPLHFDGREDAVFQEYADGERFMEYVEDHGSFTGVPMARMLEAWKTHYPAVRNGVWPQPNA
ncbi:MAG: transglutaminase family protein [Proteobacteria bacterium]|nr:transglutaminase family protein [Pseudomonadota bacterium]